MIRRSIFLLALFLGLSASWSQADFIRSAAPSSNLQAYWSFDEVGGSVAQDGSSYDRDSALQGTASMTAGGRFGGALSLNGAVGNYSVANGPGSSNAYDGVTGDTSRTVSAWIRPSGAPGDLAIANWGANTAAQKWTFRTTGANALRAEFANGGVESTFANLFDGNWHHVAVTKPTGGTGAGVQLFVDGSPITSVDSTTAVTLLTGAGQNVRVGTDFSNRMFNGLIDDLGILDLELSDAEVEAVFNLAQTPELNYDLGIADELLEAHRSAGSVLVDNLAWTYTEGLSSGLGDVVFSNGQYMLQLDASGTGLLGSFPLTPEPGSLALFALGCALAGWQVYRRKQ